MKRTGFADLPLHGGRAPAWLLGRMSRLAGAVTEAIVLERGPVEMLRRLADPFWFQAFGCLLGFDWHSSGVTTTVCGALKTGLAGRGSSGMARRYHWLGEAVQDFVKEPHADVCGAAAGEVLNLVAAESGPAREAAAALACEAPEPLLAELDLAEGLVLPRRHAVGAGDVGRTHLRKVLLRTYEEQPRDFEQLLGMRGVGPRTLRALSLLAEVLHGAPASTRDPAAFSFAHGGKDGTPHPVDRETYDRTIDVLSAAVSRCRAGHGERLQALRRLRHLGSARK